MFQTIKRKIKMNKIALLFLGLTFAFTSVAQEGHDEGGLEKKVASVQLKDMEGNAINTAELGFDGPVIISFGRHGVLLVRES